jgi:hypothetical protein
MLAVGILTGWYSLMKLSAFSRRGGQVKSVAKTAANRAKMSAFWRKVRRGELPPPRRYRKFPDPIRALARRYVWWLSPDESLALPLRVVARVMDIGTMADCATIESHFGCPVMRNALKRAEPGWFRERSWAFWHYRLGLIMWGGEPPPLPKRSFDA